MHLDSPCQPDSLLSYEHVRPSSTFAPIDLNVQASPLFKSPMVRRFAAPEFECGPWPLGSSASKPGHNFESENLNLPAARCSLTETKGPFKPSTAHNVPSSSANTPSRHDFHLSEKQSLFGEFSEPKADPATVPLRMMSFGMKRDAVPEPKPIAHF